jgi:hypothetical protein
MDNLKLRNEILKMRMKECRHGEHSEEYLKKRDEYLKSVERLKKRDEYLKSVERLKKRDEYLKSEEYLKKRREYFKSEEYLKKREERLKKRREYFKSEEYLKKREENLKKRKEYFKSEEYLKKRKEYLKSEEYSVYKKMGKNKLVLFGKFFGYPECCTKYFLDTRSRHSREEIVNKNSKNGFVVCPDHARQIEEGKTKIKDLIQNRICKTPFPKQNYELKDLEDFVDSNLSQFPKLFSPNTIQYKNPSSSEFSL